MKKQIILFILLFAILGNQNSIFGQAPVKKSNPITVTSKKIGGKSVNVVPASMLSKSSNEIKLSNGKTITALATNGNLNGVIVDGVSYKLVGGGIGTGFTCMPTACECHGIEDCNDMFGENGPCKTCIECAICDENHNCVCIRNIKKVSTTNKAKDIRTTTPITTTKK